MNNFFSNKTKSGFTLIETLVAIMIFIVALSALLALVKNSVTSGSYNKNEVIATYLAEEGADYIRNVRDEMVKINSSMSPTPWPDFTDEILSMSKSGCDVGTFNNGCSLDIYASGRKLIPCPSTCPSMTISGKPFRRKISVMSPSSEVLLIKVEVFWYNGPDLRTRTLTTALYDWVL